MRVVVADDHPVVREGVRSILEATGDIQVVAAEADGSQALDKIRRLKPDAAVLDIQMPSMSGLEIARRLKADTSHTAVVILSLHCEGVDVQSAVAAGVLAYVVKDDACEELVAATRAAVRRQYHFSTKLSASMAQALAHGRSHHTLDALTPRERDVLRLVADGLRSKEIAGRLNLSEKTIEGHRASLMDKLSIRSIAGLVKYAIRNRLADL